MEQGIAGMSEKRDYQYCKNCEMLGFFSKSLFDETMYYCRMTRSKSKRYCQPEYVPRSKWNSMPVPDNCKYYVEICVDKWSRD